MSAGPGKASSRAFGCLRPAIFQNQRLKVSLKRKVYQMVVMSTLLYRAETWMVMRRLQRFHNHCIRLMQGVTRLQQWKERIRSLRLT